MNFLVWIKNWQQEVADQLEDSIQQRTLELQITLTELADKNKLLEQQNTRDALTGVRNRAFFDQKINAEIKRSRRERSTLGLLMIDIDHFKSINDNYGHLVGDLVIKEVANRLQQELKRSTDYLCRYGGEEFAIILPNTDTEGAMLLAEQLRLCLNASPVQHEELQLSISASIGCYAAVAQISSISSDYIQAADIALYQAKEKGRNCYEFFTPDLQANIVAKKRMADDILAGFDRDEFVVYYQPQFEASVAYLLSRNLAIGAEYRTKPNNLGIADEDDAWDVFVAWAPIKNVSLTVAYVDLGNIVIRDEQRGVYASLQVGF